MNGFAVSFEAITLVFFAPEGMDPRFYGWWGDSNLVQHLVKALALSKQGKVQVIYHTPVPVFKFSDRKSMAQHMQGSSRLCVAMGPLIGKTSLLGLLPALEGQATDLQCSKFLGQSRRNLLCRTGCGSNFQ